MIRWTALLATAAAVGCGAARTDAPPAPRPPDLRAVVDSVTRTPPLHRTAWGIDVRDAATGASVLARATDRLFIPASNTKIATLAAALDLLGPDHRWTTEFTAPDIGTGTATALVVRGSGDPSFSGTFHAEGTAPLDSVAALLAAAGLARVDGPLVVDQSRFDSVLAHPAWENFDLDWYYAAPVAPFAIMEGAYLVVMTGREVGLPASVVLPHAAGLVGLDADVRSVDGSDRWNDDLRRLVGADSVILRGTIGTAAPVDSSWIAQNDPGRFAGRALARALERRGIPVAGPVIVTYDSVLAARHRGAAGAAVVWRSPTLAGIAPLSLERSNNWVTEQILKTLGAELEGEGTWSAGTRVVERYLVDTLGLDAGEAYLRDGSGLSAQNLLTPNALATVLLHAAGRPWAPVFRSALAAPGEKDGTLEQRLLAHEGRVEAKTGTIRHVNGLSGYARRLDGRLIVFSILTNASGQPASAVRAAMDRVVEAIIQEGSR